MCSDDDGKQVALDAMKHWMDHTCVKFAPRTTESDYVDFQFGDGYVRLQKVSFHTPAQYTNK